MSPPKKHIDSFSLSPGRIIGGKYVVVSRLGAGWEGEVYKVIEQRTGATRAAKLFFTQRNHNDRALNFYARKLESLRDCHIIIKYHHSEILRFRGVSIPVLISEYVEGELLESILSARPGKRIPYFEALCLIYALAHGLEQVHAKRDYHGDLHMGNVLVQRRGVHFDVKLVDLFNLGRPTAANIRDDVTDVIRILYDIVGGKNRYAGHPPEIKQILAGLKRTIIEKRFPTAGNLRQHLDEFKWEYS